MCLFYEKLKPNMSVTKINREKIKKYNSLIYFRFISKQILYISTIPLFFWNEKLLVIDDLRVLVRYLPSLLMCEKYRVNINAEHDR